MEEKVLAQGTLRSMKKTRNILIFLGVLLALLVYIVEFHVPAYIERQDLLHPWTVGEYIAWVLRRWDKHDFIVFLIYAAPGIVLIIVGVVFYAWTSKCELTITNKRVYGKSGFGKRVDLPVDSVSAVGMCWPKGITVATASGKVSFLGIQNRDEIHKCISDLLIHRQEKPVETTTIKQEIPQSNADELKKYKELLDSGIITQEEFDAKKKQLLGL